MRVILTTTVRLLNDNGQGRDTAAWSVRCRSRRLRVAEHDDDDGGAARAVVGGWINCLRSRWLSRAAIELPQLVMVDVPETAKELRLIPYATIEGNVFAVAPEFIVHDFDKVPAYKPNN